MWSYCRSESASSTFLILSYFLGAAEDGDRAETFCLRRNVLKVVVTMSLLTDSFNKHGILADF